MFHDLILFAFCTMLALTISSFIPAVYALHPLFKSHFRILFIVFTVLFGAGSVFVCLHTTLLPRIALPLLYALFCSFYALSFVLNLKNTAPIPYTLAIVFRIMFPVLVVDKQWRITVCHSLAMALAVWLSYRYKPSIYFINDLVHCAAFSAAGILIGGFTFSNQMRYLSSREQQLDTELELAQAKNEAKTVFLANMSHEIRTPINSILGLDEMILRESKEKSIVDYAAKIKISGKTLLKIINDILDFSKIEVDKLQIIPTEYELTPIINDLISTVDQQAKEKGLEFIVHIDEEIPHLLFGDEIRIKQCIQNMLNNAVKYTEKGSVMLDMGFEKLDDNNINLIVRVVDTGIGIHEKDLPRLFNAFERLDEKRNRTIEGSGLGMNIVKMLLEKMGSHLEVQSTYGKGSTFSFKVRQQVVWWAPLGNFAKDYSRYLESLESYQESFRAPNARILVVDDTKMNLIVIEGLLKQTQIQIDIALSGSETLELVQQKRYNVIFIDHRMPIMDGIETLQAMNRLDTNMNKDVPCIALTANAVAGAREMYLHAGFSDYISKPVDSEKLEKMLLRYLPKHLVTPIKRTIKPEGVNMELPDAYRQLQGIDLDVAMKNCGAKDTLDIALQEYYNIIDSRSALIEQYAQQDDVKNYTVLVHALKSSSRLIGATKVADLAAYLEQCGDAQDKASITAKTPELLALYRGYKQFLKAVAAPKDAGAVKPAIDDKKYKEALQAIKEYASVFDFNAADKVIELLETYSIPEAEKTKYEEVKKHVRAGDSNALITLLS